jgi:hypothetical protein
VLQAFAALGHGMETRLMENSVITAIAKRVNKTPAQVLLAWAICEWTTHRLVGRVFLLPPDRPLECLRKPTTAA